MLDIECDTKLQGTLKPNVISKGYYNVRFTKNITDEFYIFLNKRMLIKWIVRTIDTYIQHVSLVSTMICNAHFLNV